MNNPYPDLTDDQYRRVQYQFRNLFGTVDGRSVLIKMLCDLGFFSEITADPGQVALKNYAKLILQNCGIFEEGKEQMIVDALFDRVPAGGPDPDEEEKDREEEEDA